MRTLKDADYDQIDNDGDDRMSIHEKNFKRITMINVGGGNDRIKE